MDDLNIYMYLFIYFLVCLYKSLFKSLLPLGRGRHLKTSRKSSSQMQYEQVPTLIRASYSSPFVTPLFSLSAIAVSIFLFQFVY